MSACVALPRVPFVQTEPIARACRTWEAFYYWGPWRNESGFCNCTRKHRRGREAWFFFKGERDPVRRHQIAVARGKRAARRAST